MNDLAITGTTFFSMIAVAIAFVIILIVGYRKYFSQRSNHILQQKKEEASRVAARNKYPEVNAFRWSSTFLNVGLSLAIGLVILAFSWTSYDSKPPIPEYAMGMEGLEMIPPPPTDIKPPPPPPPPPVIETVPEEELEEEEDIEFIDTDIDTYTDEYFVPPPAKKEVPVIIPTPPPSIAEEDIPFMLIEDKPLFQECEGIERAEQESCFTDHLLEYVYGKVRYPAIARENGIEGNVILKFVIEKNGKISTIEVLRSPSSILDTEAVRVLNQLKEEVTFIPGMQRKRPVRVQFTMPVKFKLN